MPRAGCDAGRAVTSAPPAAVSPRRAAARLSRRGAHGPDDFDTPRLDGMRCKNQNGPFFEGPPAHQTALWLAAASRSDGRRTWHRRATLAWPPFPGSRQGRRQQSTN